MDVKYNIFKVLSFMPLSYTTISHQKVHPNLFLEKYDMEKSMLIDKLESKATFTFGDSQKNNQTAEFQSTSSVKDEIDKLNFLVEEKEYMNAELREEILALRNKLYHLEDTFQKNNTDLPRQLENSESRVETRLTPTWKSENEQFQFHQEKVEEDQRGRSQEKQKVTKAQIMQEMIEMKNNYENKINYIMKMMEKDQSTTSSYDLRDSTVFKGSPVKAFNDELVITDPSFVHGHTRSLTPSSCAFVNSQQNSGQIHPIPMVDSTVVGSLRSSINSTHKNPEVSPVKNSKEERIIECIRCSTDMTPSASNLVPYPLEQETPVRKRGSNKSMSEKKHAISFCNYPNSGDYSYLADFQKDSQPTNYDCKTPGISRSISYEEFSDKTSYDHKRKEYKQLKSSAKKEKSITERLDTTESLLKKINKKFDVIFKEGPKINIDIGKIKRCRGKTSRKSESMNSEAKVKYTDKVKNLIQKIIMSRGNPKENLKQDSRWKSQRNSNDSSATFRITDSKESSKFTNSRYEKIDEESSYQCSASQHSSEVNESILTKKDENIQNANKEYVIYGEFWSKENMEEAKTSGDLNRDLDFARRNGKIKRSQYRNEEDVGTIRSPKKSIRYNDTITNTSHGDKNIHSARKLKSEEFDQNWSYSKTSRKNKWVSISFLEEANDLLKNTYINQRNSNNLYKEKSSPVKPYSEKKLVGNNLRRKLLKRKHTKSSIYPKENVSFSNSNIETDLSYHRREKPVLKSMSMQKISTCVPSRSIELNWSTKNVKGSKLCKISKFAKYPMTTSNKKNSRQLSKNLKKISDMA